MRLRIAVLVVLLAGVLTGCLTSDDDKVPAPTTIPTAESTPTASATTNSSIAPSATMTSSAGTPLAGTSWQLIELTGDPVDPAFGVTLYFKGGEVTGYSGCNEFSGTFSATDESTLSVDVTFTTDAGCPEPLSAINFQSRYYDALEVSVRYFLDPPLLALHAADDATLLLFEPLDEAVHVTPTTQPVAAGPTPTTPIADYGNWEIYVMNTDGSDQHRPAPSLAGESWPAWMPDGRLTFQSDRSGMLKLYSVSPDGSGLKEWPAELAHITSPIKWSADGSRMYYASNIDSLEQLYVADTDGGNPRRITEIANGASYPDWSPDGSKAVFTNGSHGPAVIYSINTDGTGLQRLTFDQEATEDAPVWSPDGMQIAFAHFPNEGLGGIFIMDADGSNMRQLTFSEPWTDGSPAWSPDGRQIAFGRGQNIWVINVNGTDLRQLTDNPHFDEGPVWSPDGTQIAFVSNRDGGQPVECSFYGSISYRGIESLAELAWLSSEILVGEVVKQYPSGFGTLQDDGFSGQNYPIYTDYLIAIDTWIRGSRAPTIRLRMDGGTVGACRQIYDSEPQVSVGARLLLFLQPDEFNTALPSAGFLIAGSQGFWPVASDGTVMSGRYTEHNHSPVAELAEAIRAILRQPEPDYFDLIPLDEAPLVDDG